MPGVPHDGAPGALPAVPGRHLPGQDVLKLSMKRAVELATSPEGNVNIQIAGEAVKQAQARSAQARAALLPNFEGAVSEIDQTRNLAALGIRFNSADSRVQLPDLRRAVQRCRCAGDRTQSVFDFSSIRRYQASKVGVNAARSSEAAHRRPGGGAGGTGLYGGASGEMPMSKRRRPMSTLSEALLKQAENQKKRGHRNRASRSRAPECSWPTTGSACW